VSRDEISELEKKIVKRKTEFRELEDVLPHENGWNVIFVSYCVLF